MTWRVEDCDALTLLGALDENSIDALVTDPPAGIGFMGKAWDGDKGGRPAWVAWLQEIMVECLRVLKPGAHGLIWALPRTSHWTGAALEEAGFEVRDVVTHLFGTGFPKSHNVSKAIDKMKGAERETIGKVAVPRRNRNGTAALGGSWQDAPDITAPATPEAQQWDGWGTALKPAAEFWFVVRKPFKGSVASNVLEHGTGALNIDGCRVKCGEANYFVTNPLPPKAQGAVNFLGATAVRRGGGHSMGRWPAHLVLTGDARAMLDTQSNEASRFFYCPKASKAEREAGLDGFSKASFCQGYPDKSSTPESTHHNGMNTVKQRRNRHPTVKPIELMRWLCRLITPPGGVVLDPFSGSGTTGCAAVMEGFDFIGCEMQPEHAEVARARIAHWANHAEEP